MGKFSREGVEKKRKKIIDKLIAFNVYKKDDKQLYELSLSELENELRRIQQQSHPHGEFGSIKWTHTKSKDSY
ncbi:Fur-regulated basic protein FbpA [Niallia oryzisoli]|uniref:Fur-regulated basic protein FbpA n=1 Tax=Niallia oryzisoli TaxID=1737571 RepID=A0ABZ2CJY4_9BACI